MPKTKEIHDMLKKVEGWTKVGSRVWNCKKWSIEKWERVVTKLWTTKRQENKKYFEWRVLVGAIPTSDKAATRKTRKQDLHGM